jgi:indole-3-glycerol phosphate synthase
VATYLDEILAAHRAAAAGPARGFRAALAEDPGLSVIAEIKRRSPSKGDLAADLDPATMAKTYEDAGATCVSVLTDTEFFGGSPDDLRAARDACALPVLRKDFTVTVEDVFATKGMGADAVLLIVAALDDAALRDFLEAARFARLDALVEVHDESELERALAVGADLVGVNQRDLVTFEVDTARAVRVAPTLPDGVVRVAESGITGAADAAVLAGAGYHAVLVGEHLVRAGDPAQAVTELRRARS